MKCEKCGKELGDSNYVKISFQELNHWDQNVNYTQMKACKKCYRRIKKAIKNLDK